MTIDDTPAPRWAAHPAPRPLALLQRFVNSHAYSGRADQLATATSARSWLRRNGVSTTVTTRDLARLTAARDALRERLRSHDPQHAPHPAVPLERALPNPSLTWHVDGDRITLVGAGHGLERFLNDLAAAIVSASLTDTWRQLKVCGNDECHVAFWDQTKNGSARYCSADVCANRSRQRAFRQRSQEQGR